MSDRPKLIVANDQEFAELIENAVLNGIEARRRVYVCGAYGPLCVARKLLRGGNRELPQHVSFYEMEASVMRSTLPPMLALRSELATPMMGRSTLLVAVVPPLPSRASVMPLIETCRLATAGAVLIATPRDAAMINPNLVTQPEWRTAA